MKFITFHTLMLQLRKIKGWSLKEASEKIGISEIELAQVEKHYKFLSPYYLLKVADVYDYPFANLAISTFLIDEFKDPDKVRRVFETIELPPDCWMHISSVDDLSEEEINHMKNYPSMLKNARKSVQ